jgi:hypothetical protein
MVMTRSCCAKPIARIIQVGDVEAGIIGLDQILAIVHASGVRDDQRTRDTLVRAVRDFGNYIAPVKECEYADALMREYSLYKKGFEAADPTKNAR